MLQLLRPAQAILGFCIIFCFIIEALNTILQTDVFFSFWVMNADFSQHAQNMLSRL